MSRAKKEFWMKEATENKGGLHRSLGVQMGKKIPVKKIEKAAHSKNPKIKKEAILAETLAKHRPHKMGGSVKGGSTMPEIEPKKLKINFRGSCRSR